MNTQLIGVKREKSALQIKALKGYFCMNSLDALINYCAKCMHTGSAQRHLDHLCERIYSACGT